MSDENDNNGGPGRLPSETYARSSLPSEQPAREVDTGEAVIGGLYSGMSEREAVALADRNLDPIRATSHTPTGGLEARTEDGYRIVDQSELGPDSIVTIPGFGETSLSVAMQQGLVIKSADGTYRAVSASEVSEQQERDAQAEQEKADMEATGEPFADKESTAWLKQAVDSNVGAVLDVAESFMATESGAEPVVPENVVQAVAEANGISIDQANMRIARVSAAYHAEAANAVTKETGIGGNVVFEALHASRGAPGLNDVIRAHMSTGKPQGYAQFVRDYVAQLDQTPEGTARIMATNEATGGRLRFDGRRVLVKLPNGMELAWADAVFQRKVTIG